MTIMIMTTIFCTYHGIISITTTTRDVTVDNDHAPSSYDQVQHSLRHACPRPRNAVCGPEAIERADQSQKHSKAALFLAAICLFLGYLQLVYPILETPSFSSLQVSFDVPKSLLTYPSQCAALI